MFRLYQNSLKKRPTATNMFTAGVICLGGDVVAQTYFEQNAQFDYVRAGRMAAFGVFWWAPVTSKWMSVLERLVPGKTGLALTRKILIDQCLFSPCILAAFFTVYELTMLNGFETIKHKITHELWPTVLTNWSVWGPAQLANFYFMPLAYRVIFIQVVAFFWNIYLSIQANK